MDLPSLQQEIQPSAHQVDVHVGMRMRLRRRAIDLTQHALAEKVGVTFQQIQKYEQGKNRMSAGTLWAAAAALNVPIGYFFDGLGSDAPDVTEAELRAVYAFLMAPEGIEVAQAYTSIRSTRLKRRLLELMRDLSALADEPQASRKTAKKPALADAL